MADFLAFVSSVTSFLGCVSPTIPDDENIPNDENISDDENIPGDENNPNDEKTSIANVRKLDVTALLACISEFSTNPDDIKTSIAHVLDKDSLDIILKDICFSSSNDDIRNDYIIGSFIRKIKDSFIRFSPFVKCVRCGKGERTILCKEPKPPKYDSFEIDFLHPDTSHCSECSRSSLSLHEKFIEIQPYNIPERQLNCCEGVRILDLLGEQLMLPDGSLCYDRLTIQRSLSDIGFNLGLDSDFLLNMFVSEIAKVLKKSSKCAFCNNHSSIIIEKEKYKSDFHDEQYTYCHANTHMCKGCRNLRSDTKYIELVVIN